jgi:hypothetical protein
LLKNKCNIEIPKVHSSYKNIESSEAPYGPWYKRRNPHNYCFHSLRFKLLIVLNFLNTFFFVMHLDTYLNLDSKYLVNSKHQVFSIQ